MVEIFDNGWRNYTDTGQFISDWKMRDFGVHDKDGFSSFDWGILCLTILTKPCQLDISSSWHGFVNI